MYRELMDVRRVVGRKRSSLWRKIKTHGLFVVVCILAVGLGIGLSVGMWVMTGYEDIEDVRFYSEDLGFTFKIYFSNEGPLAADTPVGIRNVFVEGVPSVVVNRTVLRVSAYSGTITCEKEKTYERYDYVWEDWGDVCEGETRFANAGNQPVSVVLSTDSGVIEYLPSWGDEGWMYVLEKSEYNNWLYGRMTVVVLAGSVGFVFIPNGAKTLHDLW